MYTDIENRIIDLAICKGVACNDSSVEEEEKRIEEELEERRGDGEEGRRSNNSELLHSVRSSKEYWQALKKKINKEEEPRVRGIARRQREKVQAQEEKKEQE